MLSFLYSFVIFLLLSFGSFNKGMSFFGIFFCSDLSVFDFFLFIYFLMMLYVFFLMLDSDIILFIFDKLWLFCFRVVVVFWKVDILNGLFFLSFM